jgi:Flp pilus assembly protein TadG
MYKNRKKVGQATVEMALVLPLFLFTVIGIFDFGRVMHAWSTLNYQCIQAARAATKRTNPLVARDMFTSTTHAPEASVRAAFWRFRSPMMSESNYGTIEFNGVGVYDVKDVQVKASFEFSPITPLLGGLVGSGSKPGTITIHASANEHKE